MWSIAYVQTESEDAGKSLDSYIALFPNFAERIPTDFGFNATTDRTFDLCDTDVGFFIRVASARAMHVQYYMFAEVTESENFIKPHLTQPPTLSGTGNA